jgi:hypothetical protein
MKRNFYVVLVVMVCAFIFAAATYGTPLQGSIDQASGSGWQSAYMALKPAHDFKKGNRLQIKLQGTAEWVRVRLLPEGANADKPTGLLGGKMRVPTGGIVEVTLKKDYPKVKQISVHAGKEAWGELLNPKGGEVEIVSIEITK